MLAAVLGMQVGRPAGAAGPAGPAVGDPKQVLERTVFQTGQPYGDRIDLRADVAIVYGIGPDMPARVKSWRDRGYRIHLMTGVAWGNYQDYLYGRFDGINHVDEAQTQKNGEVIGHGGDVYYMSPGKSYGLFLCKGIQRALDAGVEAVHLEEPEFWVRGGYGAGFKREWKDFYHADWEAPDSSPEARWKASKLMYFLYRRALGQVFAFIQDYNKKTGKHVRCYVPTHSLLNYASWNIVSPESSIARIAGCDGYIAQVWTGTARTSNTYQGVSKERTFETAFLEYGAMQNLVRSTGRQVWYLADPVEDDPNHDWGDYRRNWESTLTASLLQPQVWNYEVMPWPERIFNGKYPSEKDKGERVPISDAYATELQVVINALKDMNQRSNRWDAGTQGIGVVVGDSLMFQRGEPNKSDDQLNHFYGLAMPFVKRGMPVQPIQLENVGLAGYLKGTKVLLMSYEGMKPLTPDVHKPIADWVRSGGTLVFVDDDRDPYNRVPEWWNSDGRHFDTPRQDLFRLLGLGLDTSEGEYPVGKGNVVFLHRSPSGIAHDAKGGDWLYQTVRAGAPSMAWRESGSIVLRRGPYVVAAGMDETSLPRASLEGSFVDLFDAELRVQTSPKIEAGSRHFLIDLNLWKQRLIAASAAVTDVAETSHSWEGTVEGIGSTPCFMMFRAPEKTEVTVDGKVRPVYDELMTLVRPSGGFFWVHTRNTAQPHRIRLTW